MIEILINKGIIRIMSVSDLFDEFEIEVEELKWFLMNNHQIELEEFENEGYESQRELVKEFLLSNAKYRKKIK